MGGVSSQRPAYLSRQPDSGAKPYPELRDQLIANYGDQRPGRDLYLVKRPDDRDAGIEAGNRRQVETNSRRILGSVNSRLGRFTAALRIRQSLDTAFQKNLNTEAPGARGKAVHSYGDVLLEHIGSDERVQIGDLRRIDHEIAHSLAAQSTQTDDIDERDLLRLQARLYHHAATAAGSKQPIGNWQKKVYGAFRMRRAIEADLKTAGRATANGARKAAHDTIAGVLRQNELDGATPANLRQLRASMHAQGMQTPNLDRLLEFSDVEANYRDGVRPLMEEMTGWVEGALKHEDTGWSIFEQADIDDDDEAADQIRGQLREAVGESEKAMALMDAHVDTAGLDDSQAEQIQQHLEKSYLACMTARQGLKQHGVQPELQEFLSVNMASIRELSNSLRMERSGGIIDRTPFANGAATEFDAPLRELDLQDEFGGILSASKSDVLIPSSAMQVKRDQTVEEQQALWGDTGKSTFLAAKNEYNDAMNDLRSAHTAFQTYAGDQNLQHLSDALDRAKTANSEMQRTLQQASRRHHPTILEQAHQERQAKANPKFYSMMKFLYNLVGKTYKFPTLGPTETIKESRQDVDELAFQVKDQRVALQRLSVMVGDVNHTRNRAAEEHLGGEVVPDEVSSTDQKFGRRRARGFDPQSEASGMQRAWRDHAKRPDNDPSLQVHARRDILTGDAKAMVHDVVNEVAYEAA